MGGTWFRRSRLENGCHQLPTHELTPCNDIHVWKKEQVEKEKRKKAKKGCYLSTDSRRRTKQYPKANSIPASKSSPSSLHHHLYIYFLIIILLFYQVCIFSSLSQKKILPHSCNNYFLNYVVVTEKKYIFIYEQGLLYLIPFYRNENMYAYV